MTSTSRPMAGESVFAIRMPDCSGWMSVFFFIWLVRFVSAVHRREQEQGRYKGARVSILVSVFRICTIKRKKFFLSNYILILAIYHDLVLRLYSWFVS